MMETVPQRVLFLLLALLVTTAYGRKIECFVDDAGDKMDPNNIYKCALDETCCREEGLPSCCRTKDSTVAAWEQAKLWSMLIGCILFLGILMWFCRHDGDCCCNAKDGRKSCCGKPYGKKPEDNYVQESDDDDSDTEDGPPTLQKDPDNFPEKKPLPADDLSPPPAREKAPPSPTSNRDPVGDVPPSYSDLELNDIP